MKNPIPHAPQSVPQGVSGAEKSTDAADAEDAEVRDWGSDGFWKGKHYLPSGYLTVRHGKSPIFNGN